MNKLLFKLLANRPLLMLPGAVEALVSMTSENMVKGSEIPLPEMVGSNINGDTPITVAVIPITGALRHRSSGFLSWLYGSMSYDLIRKQFNEAVQDESIDGIIFDIDSPGGDVAGCFDLVDEIFAARGKKPVCAIANEHIFSAAYAIASATDEIYIPRTGQVGSIGVISVHIDESKRDEMDGFEFTSIFAGARKNDFSPHFKLSDKAQAIAQGQVDKTYDLFCEVVSRNRGVTKEKIAGTEAGIFSGNEAVENGLADFVMSRKEAINQILSNLNNNRKKGGLMGQKEDLEKILSEEGGLQALQELGFFKEAAEVPEVPETPTKQDGKPDLPKDSSGPDYADALAITELCNIAGKPEMSAQLLGQNVSVDQARKIIMKAKEEDSKVVVTSTVRPNSTGEVNPFVAECQKIAGQGGD